MAFTHALSTNRYGEADLIVSSDASQGTHTTLAGAMADAVAGQTIFLRTSVTENVTLTAGVNITAWTGGSLNTPTIIGTLTMTTAGTCNISGIKLVTNSAVFLSMTGVAATIVNLNNCYLNCTNNTGITYSVANVASQLNIMYCNGNLATTGIAYISDSSTGTTTMSYSDFLNTGASTTANTKSAGTLLVLFCKFVNPWTYSSSSVGSSFIESVIDDSPINTAALTTSGTGGINFTTGFMAGGTASAVVVGSGTIVGLSNVNLSSSNTNAIAGTGTIQVAAVSFTGTSSTIVGTLTVTRFIVRPSFSTVNQVFTGSGTYTPTAGMVYCQIELVGGGGGSGGVANPGAGNVGVTAGGGGGGYARKIVTAATIGASQTVTIGAAGAAGTSGNNAGGTGGTTSVGAIVSATGGGGSAGSAGNAVAQSQSGGAGGAGSSGDININGSPGGLAVGFFAQAIAGGYGGASYFGGGQQQSVANAVGASNGIYGTGASGDALTAAGGNQAGAAGVAGVVIIQEYVLS